MCGILDTKSGSSSRACAGGNIAVPRDRLGASVIVSSTSDFTGVRALETVEDLRAAMGLRGSFVSFFLCERGFAALAVWDVTTGIERPVGAG